MPDTNANCDAEPCDCGNTTCVDRAAETSLCCTCFGDSHRNKCWACRGERCGCGADADDCDCHVSPPCHYHTHHWTEDHDA